MLRILIVDQTQFICDAISTVIDRDTGMKVIGQATTNQEALSQIKNCDVMLIHAQLSSRDKGDDNMNAISENGYNPRDVNTIQLLKQVSGVYSEIKTLVLGLPKAVPVILHYLEAGANGYVLEEDLTSTLLQKIRAVYDERPIIHPVVTAALVSRVSELKEKKRSSLPQEGHDLVGRLTKREQEVLQLVEQNLSNREIANALFIEVGTVKNHVHSVLKKLRVDSREEAALFAPLLATKNQNTAVPDVKSSVHP